MAGAPVGRYRSKAFGNHEPTAYVEDGNIASFVPESTYRTKGYRPSFDELPTEEEFRSRGGRHAKDA